MKNSRSWVRFQYRTKNIMATIAAIASAPHRNWTI